MFKNVKCHQCNYEYDEALDQCPKCHTDNESFDSNFKHIQMVHWGKQIALFLTGFAGLFILQEIISLILIKTGLVDRDSGLATIILNAVIYGILFVALFLILFKDTKKILKSFTKWEPYVAGVVAVAAILLFGVLYNMLLVQCGVKIEPNKNQDGVNKITASYTAVSIIIFGIFGPICEELTYRVGLFSFSKRISKWLAYPVSILVFAFIHFDFKATNMNNELLNLPYYIFAGFALTFTYDKFGFAGAATAHILNNMISFIPMQILIGAIH